MLVVVGKVPHCDSTHNTVHWKHLVAHTLSMCTLWPLYPHSVRGTQGRSAGEKKKSLQHHTPQSIDAIRQTLKAMDVIFKKKYAIYYIGVISRVSTELSVYWY